MPRFSLRTRISGTRLVLRMHGELDGSTACRVLDAVAHAPQRIREMVIDLYGVNSAESFGLEVLARGLSASARGRPVQLLGTPASAPTSGAPARGHVMPPRDTSETGPGRAAS